MKTLTIILCLALAQCGLSPAWADTVELPDAPDPFSEPGGPDAADLVAVGGQKHYALFYCQKDRPLCFSAVLLFDHRGLYTYSR